LTMVLYASRETLDITVSDLLQTAAASG